MHADPVRLRQGFRAVGTPTAEGGQGAQSSPWRGSRCAAAAGGGGDPRTGAAAQQVPRAPELWAPDRRSAGVGRWWLVRGLTHVALERPGPHRVILTAWF